MLCESLQVQLTHAMDGSSQVVASQPPLPWQTPKRKHGEMDNNALPSFQPTTAAASSHLYHQHQFSFDPHALPADDGSTSPRSYVTHRFRGLALEGGVGHGGAVVPLEVGSSGSRASLFGMGSLDKAVHDSFGDCEASDDPTAQGLQRKRQKVCDAGLSAGDPLRSGADAVNTHPGGRDGYDSPQAEQERQSSWSSLRFALAEKDGALQSETIADTNGESGQAEQPLTLTSRSKRDRTRLNTTAPRKRAGTPPLTAKTNPAAYSPDASDSDSDSTERVITDPVRASLTWHEDEITIYDPDDSDDDGTGINGIGFKPTPAIAHARWVKRRRQLAEYRKREERDARARRSAARRLCRGSRKRASASPTTAPGLAERKDKVESRHVRFLEERSQIIGI